MWSRARFRTPRCAGFSWFADTSCHLADASAKLQFGAKSVSGTSSCYATRSDMLRDEAELMNGPPSSYCQRQQGRCTGRLWERFGPKPPSPKTPVSLDVADWDGDGTLEIASLLICARDRFFGVQGHSKLKKEPTNLCLTV